MKHHWNCVRRVSLFQTSIERMSEITECLFWLRVEAPVERLEFLYQINLIKQRVIVLALHSNESFNVLSSFVCMQSNSPTFCEERYSPLLPSTKNSMNFVFHWQVQRINHLQDLTLKTLVIEMVYFHNYLFDAIRDQIEVEIYSFAVWKKQIFHSWQKVILVH